MAANLRGSKRKGGRSAGSSGCGGGPDPCPVCLEALTEDQFRFPCGHGVCSDCERRLATRNFLSCPTCRTPREGVSQRQVDRANHARARSEQEADTEHELVVFAGGRRFQVLFFPDESEGQHPFGPLDGSGGPQLRARNVLRRGANVLTHADAAEQAVALRVAEDMLAEDELSGAQGSERLTLHGPMRELVDALTRPISVPEFLAQRERLRRADVPAAAPPSRVTRAR